MRQSFISPRKSIVERRITLRRETLRLPIFEPSLLERRLYEAFDVFDTARTGEVNVRDLGTIIRSLGCVITEAELQEIQVEVEDVESNCVPINRFVEYMSKVINERKFKPAEPEELLKAFQLFDPENRGYIMKEDLEKSTMEIGEPFTKEEVADMMAVACDAETGKINYEDYINLLIKWKLKKQQNWLKNADGEAFSLNKIILNAKKYIYYFSGRNLYMKGI
ncbi:PREDICTED: EF-hand calcium-binding domain-containing protein 2-like isoform X1 [Wasmannia auropunctata]|uniref:EF-hand calcium-binding domain-containing protein 2-like isoform X1 n=1 Tax=Wasmannia auropunctata TaxID=64793 RepID=UPI0005F02E11|nr:PREDICTED: EF-hand calcium-binding domain-containing protein 2-like isoform X1 [Wasmannia auropunctata]